MHDRTMLATTSNIVANSTRKTLKSIGNHLNEVSKEDAAPYMMSATTAGMFGLLYAVTALEGGYTSSHLALACAAFEFGTALNQYNGDNANVLAVKSVAAKPYHVAVGMFNLFSNKLFPQEQHSAAVAQADENEARVSTSPKAQ